MSCMRYPRMFTDKVNSLRSIRDVTRSEQVARITVVLNQEIYAKNYLINLSNNFRFLKTFQIHNFNMTSFPSLRPVEGFGENVRLYYYTTCSIILIIKRQAVARGFSLAETPGDKLSLLGLLSLNAIRRHFVAPQDLVACRPCSRWQSKIMG